MQIMKAQKRQSSWQSFFTLLGSECAKSACRMLMKLTLGVILMPFRTHLVLPDGGVWDRGAGSRQTKTKINCF